MTLEELSAKHAALAETVQILAGMQVKTEEMAQQTQREVQQTQRDIQRLTTTMNSAFTRFARILDNHEDRIERLEGNSPQ
jgi:predicted  nucleic acid-binding Zn-ribbon protein